MTPPSSKPAVLIVHGAYFFADAWQPFRARLEQSGFDTVCPQLPTCGDKGPKDQKAGLDDDAAVIQAAARSLFANDQLIIVLAHSYGGVVACHAFSDRFLAEVTLPGAAASNVTNMLWLSCWIPVPGCSLGDIGEKHGWQTNVALEFGEDGTARGTNTDWSFFGDIKEVDPRRAAELAASTTTHNLVSVGSTPVAGAPWKVVPSQYLFCTQDNGILPALQRSMVEDVREAGGQMEIIEINSAHCPFLSKPEEIVDLIRDLRP